jgi:hypothetical protein
MPFMVVVSRTRVDGKERRTLHVQRRKSVCFQITFPSAASDSRGANLPIRASLKRASREKSGVD